jgi:ubiquitin C-terminal hydrolase
MKGLLGIFKRDGNTAQKENKLTVKIESTSDSESEGSIPVLSTSFDKTAIDKRNIDELDHFLNQIITIVEKNKSKKDLKHRCKRLKATKEQFYQVLCPALISPKLLEKIFQTYTEFAEIEGTEVQAADVRKFFGGLAACCYGTTDSKLSYCFKLYDEDGDDQLSYDELCDMMDSLQKLGEIHSQLMKSQSTLLTFSRSSKPDQDSEAVPKITEEIKVLDTTGKDDNEDNAEMSGPGAFRDDHSFNSEQLGTEGRQSVFSSVALKKDENVEQKINEPLNIEVEGNTLDDRRLSVIKGLPVFDDLNEKLKAITIERTQTEESSSESSDEDEEEDREESSSDQRRNELVDTLFRSLNYTIEKKVKRVEYLRWIHRNPYSLGFLDRIKHIAIKPDKRKENRNLSSEEKEIIQSCMDKMKPKVGDECYIISAKWWRVWCDYVGYNLSDNEDSSLDINYPPGPIDNYELTLQESQLEELVELAGFPLLRENLIEFSDYITITKDAWESLFSWYGGGPKIYRQVLSIDEKTSPIQRRQSTLESVRSSQKLRITSQIQLDLYPLLLGLGSIKDRKLTGRCLCSFEITGEELKELACKQLNVQYVQSMKFWAYYPDTEPVLIEDSKRPLRELGLTSGYIILLDFKSKHERSASAVLPKWLYRADSKDVGTAVPTLTVGGGIVGLINLGNTCFLNAALQGLTHTPALVKLFLDDSYKQDINTSESDGKFTDEFASLIKSMWKARPYTYVAPQTFRMALIRKSPQFGGSEQHDSQEALGLILDFLHNELNLVMKKINKENPDYKGQTDEELSNIYWENHLIRDASLIVALFEGQFKSHCVCITCKHEIVKFHPFMFLSLPLPENHTSICRVTVVFSDEGQQPVILKVRVEKKSTISSLIKSFGEVLGIDVESKQFLLAEVKESYVFGFLRMSRLIHEINDRENIYAFQIETPPEPSPDPVDIKEPEVNSPESEAESEINNVEEENEEEVEEERKTKPPPLVIPSFTKLRIVLLHRSTKAEWTLTGRKPRNILFGIPCIMALICDKSSRISGKLLYEKVSARLKKTFDITNISKEYGSQKGTSSKGTPSNLVMTPSTPQSPLSASVSSPIDGLRRPASSASTKQVFPEWTFALRYVNNDGTTCSRCNSEIYSPKLACTGCLVDFSDNLVELRDGETLAIEWNLKRTKSSREAVEKVFCTTIAHSSLTEAGNQNDRMANLDDIIQEYEKAEWMSQDDYFCPNCKANRQGIKRETIWRLPPILMIQFKRFAYSLQGCVKNDMMVSFPLNNLNMTPYLTPHAEAGRRNLLELQHLIKQDNSHRPFPKSKSIPQTDDIYDLFAVISHLGTFYDGHYITHAKDATRNTWFCFNDSVCKEWQPGTDIVNSYHAYVIFYQRKNVPSLERLRSDMKQSLERILQRETQNIQKTTEIPTANA